ncbi:MAG TPA: sensor histidine kinase [Woeseiaceae bacterium]|jgi:signal transduction histidine kinase|nr:sensor histidine kinase [Woeseiaceae bacterium]
MKAEQDIRHADTPPTLVEIIERVRQISAENERLVRHLADGESRFRRLARAAWRVQEEERRGIALEMHDGLGQVLTALINHLQHSPSAAAEADRDRAVALAQSALTEVRRLSRALRPSVLDDLGLGAALRWLSRTTSESSEVAIALAVPDRLTLDEETETIVFRVVQEALTNVVKHSGATRARISIEQQEGSLRVAIVDNGCGFDADGVLAGTDGGLGVRGMRDRAALFGGELGIESAPGEGTMLTLDLPNSVR